MSHFQDKIMKNIQIPSWFSLSPSPPFFTISLSFCLSLFLFSPSSSHSFPLSFFQNFGTQPLCCKPRFGIQATRRGHMWVFEPKTPAKFMRIIKDCFMLLSFGIIYYTAIVLEYHILSKRKL